MFMKNIILIFILKELTDILSLNVARHKLGNLCGSMNLNWKFFDGDKTMAHKIYFVNRTCKGADTKFTIMLEDDYYVHYVVIYLGNSRSVEPMDYYTSMAADDEKMYPCGQYRKLISSGTSPLGSYKPNDGLRINCKLIKNPVSEVRFFMTMKTDFAFSEVEVHTLASGISKEPVLYYRGCFEIVKSREVIPYTTFTACWMDCHNRDFVLMAIKESKECHCAVEYDPMEEKDGIYCDICSKPSKPCGGYDGSYSVYVVNIQLPYYEGCAEGELENGIPSEPLDSDRMNVSFCLKYCQFSSYAWVQNTSCRCSNSTTEMDLTSTRCKTECPGEEDEICGGNNRFSVFGTCKKNEQFLTCSKLFNCNDTIDIYGQCSGKCRPGFVGDYCLGRDLTVEKFEIDPIYLVLIGLAIVFVCIVIFVYLRLAHDE